MKEYLKQMKLEFLLSSVLCILLGIVLIIWGERILTLIGSALGVILLLVGIIYLGSFFLAAMSNGISALIGATLCLIGIWILIQPEVIVSIVPIVFGVLLILHGVKALSVAFESRKYGYSNWMISALLAALSILLGIFCIVYAFGLMKLTTVIIGIALIYNGVSNIWVASRATKAERMYSHSNTIDVEFKDE